VAIIPYRVTGPKNRKVVTSHVQNVKAPQTAMICVKARVAMQNRNFSPKMGLHNGSIGTVEEIVFDQGKNPNHGDHPRYSVVEMPLHCGPVWDQNNPKVWLSIC
jgi:hypothetical protein